MQNSKKEEMAWALECEAEDEARRNQPVPDIEAACAKTESWLKNFEAPPSYIRTVIAAARRVSKLEAALQEIATDSDAPDNWNPDEDEWWDWNNVHDSHTHGFREGEWVAAKKARAALAESRK